jgi:hypothetical protein
MIDYNETFPPMVKIISLWILFVLATIHDYHVHQLDLQTTFYMVIQMKKYGTILSLHAFTKWK